MNKNDFTWNYYHYSVINSVNGAIRCEYDDIDLAKQVCRELNDDGGKYFVQQQHCIARII